MPFSSPGKSPSTSPPTPPSRTVSSARVPPHAADGKSAPAGRTANDLHTAEDHLGQQSCARQTFSINRPAAAPSRCARHSHYLGRIYSRSINLAGFQSSSSVTSSPSLRQPSGCCLTSCGSSTIRSVSKCAGKSCCIGRVAVVERVKVFISVGADTMTLYNPSSNSSSCLAPRLSLLLPPKYRLMKYSSFCRSNLKRF